VSKRCCKNCEYFRLAMYVPDRLVPERIIGYCELDGSYIPDAETHYCYRFRKREWAVVK